MTRLLSTLQETTMIHCHRTHFLPADRPGGADLMVQDLKQKVFPTREMRFLAVTAAGKEVRVV
jgi:hypothetical protein